MLHAVDFDAEFIEIFGRHVDAGPRQEKISVVAGNSLGDPQKPGVNLMRVVEGSKCLRADPLGVPKMEELVGHGGQELSVRGLADKIVLAHRDARGIQMFEPAGSSLRLNLK